MKKYDVIIIGAGISGLSLAYHCAGEGYATLVLEKNRRVGGTFYSHRFSGPASGFWIELGAHTCYNSYGNLLRLMEAVHIMDRMVKRERVGYKVLIDSRLKSIPSQMNFGELLLSVPRLFTSKKTGQSIKSYYSRIVGRNNFERLFGPVFNAVICQKADDFPADLLFKKRDRRKDVMRSFTLNNGIQSIAEALTHRQGMEVMTDKAVEAIAATNGFFTVRTVDGSIYESHSLAVATPPDSAARLLHNSFPSLSSLLSQIRVETVETVGVAVRKGATPLPPLAGIIPVDDSFYSVVSRDTVRDENFRGFSFHFKPGKTGGESKLEHIAEVLKVHRNHLEEVASTENIVPSLFVGHDSLVREIDRFIAGKRLLLTGNYFSGLAIEDCVSRSLNEFLRLKDGLIERRHQ